MFVVQRAHHFEYCSFHLFALGFLFLSQQNYFHNEDYINSFKYLNIANSNDDYEILYYLGACKYHLGQYQSAIPFYKKSLIINPNNPYAIYLLGQTYIALGDKKEAKRQLKLLLNLDNTLFETLKLSFNTKFDI